MKPRLYFDTSVFGGVYDEEFEKISFLTNPDCSSELMATAFNGELLVSKMGEVYRFLAGVGKLKF